MVQFSKIEGIGNDYIFIDNFSTTQVAEADLPALARAVSDRHFGVGADGLIVVLPPRTPDHDFRFRMFNADGSEGEMCGNGMRGFARFVYDRGLTRKTSLRIETLAGTISPQLILDAAGRVEKVRVDMGPPRLRRSEIPMAGPDTDRVLDEPFEFEGQTLQLSAVSMGNPHAIFFADDLDGLELERIGPRLERHPAFPRRTNVHFVQVLGPAEVRMRTWERGSGITLACGTGASAVVVACHLLGKTGRQVLVHLPGGDLEIEWSEQDGHVYKTGPATEVCQGVFTKEWR